MKTVKIEFCDFVGLYRALSQQKSLKNSVEGALKSILTLSRA